ncbi:MAG: cupredoxin domain-containing protein [Marinicella sp.]
MKLIFLLIIMLSTNMVRAATHSVKVYGNRFEPEVVVVQSGDTVEWLVQAGNHQISSTVNNHDISFTSPNLSPNDQFSVVINGTSGEIRYSSSADTGMQGAILIESAANNFVIDEKINAAYHNPSTPGQGFLFEYVPSTQLMIAYWFTYNKAGDNQQWLIATGTPAGNRVTLAVVEPTGGQLNATQPITSETWGEVTIEFENCFQATAYFNADVEKHSGDFPLERLYLAQNCQ